MGKKDSDISILKEKIEEIVSKKLKVPSDFDFLSGAIWERIHESISASTLKRIWGYVGKDIVARETTLDILSRFLNYKNWDDFKEKINKNAYTESDISLVPYIRTQDLTANQKVEFHWAPDRRCVAEYQGGTMFKILIIENSQILRVGDRFCTGVFVLNESVFMDKLIQNDSEPICYLVGKSTGLTYLQLID